MSENLDIIRLADVKILVDSFYEKVRKDPLLSPIFNKVIGDKWDIHLDKMYRFWQTVLLKEHTYLGAPFAPHMKLPVEAKHFDRWQELFNETINEKFTGEKASEAKWRASKMAEMFQIKIAHYKKSKANPLL